MREDITNFNTFKTRILLFGVVFALIIEAGSLFILGPRLEFLYGLALGTSISIVNFNILVITGKKVLSSKKPMLGYFGYMIRLCIYGMAFYMALKISIISGIAAILGFMSLTLAIFFLHMVKPMLKGKQSGEEIEAPARPVNYVRYISSETEEDRPDGVSELWPQKKKRGKLYKTVFGSVFDDNDDDEQTKQ